MRIGILGAGIGGLALAHRLEQHGVSADVFERTQTLRALGAGVSLAPQALDVLSGPTQSRIRSLGSPMRHTTLRSIDGSILHTGPWPHNAKPNNPTISLLRAHLQTALVDSLTSTRLTLGKGALDYWPEDDGSVAALFSDGTQASFDVLVCADGIWSSASRHIDPQQHVTTHESVVLRGLVPTEVISRATTEGTKEALLWVGEDRNFLCYPVDSGRQYYVTAYISRNYRGSVDDFSCASGRSDAIDAFNSDDPAIGQILAGVSICEYRPSFYRTKPRAVNKGFLVGLGDSIGAIPSHSAQGATSAIITAGWLGDAIAASKFDRNQLVSNLYKFNSVSTKHLSAVYDYATAVASHYFRADFETIGEKVKVLNSLITEHGAHLARVRGTST